MIYDIIAEVHKNYDRILSEEDIKKFLSLYDYYLVDNYFRKLKKHPAGQLRLDRFGS